MSERNDYKLLLYTNYKSGNEEPLDKDMRFSELESNNIFICLEDE